MIFPDSISNKVISILRAFMPTVIAYVTRARRVPVQYMN